MKNNKQLNTTLHYAGIGSRETPANVLKLMQSLAHRLGELGYTLHSGGCVGADLAFESGANAGNFPTEIYLPWRGYENSTSNRYFIPESAFKLAEQFHPAWERCSFGARKLHARNGQIILGTNLDRPVDFVLCWHNGTGGTMQGVRIAKHYGIPVINLNDPTWREQITRLVKPSNDCCPDCGAPADVYDKQHGCSNCGYGYLNHEVPKANAWNSDAGAYISADEIYCNSFTKVENLAAALECDYNTAFDIVYNSAVIYDENETDNTL